MASLLCRVSTYVGGLSSAVIICFFFNDTATTEIYTLSLHDALPICGDVQGDAGREGGRNARPRSAARRRPARGDEDAGRARLRLPPGDRSEEHTSELQSQFHLVCRLLLEKKKNPLKSGHGLPLMSCEYVRWWPVIRCYYMFFF